MFHVKFKKKSRSHLYTLVEAKYFFQIQLVTT